jgi:ubiquinone/menaquinone biosynthesis C-methylase UbiE
MRSASRCEATVAPSTAAVLRTAAARRRSEPRTRLKLPEMEGAVARWYARLRRSGSLLEAYRKQALQLADHLPNGAAVLEVAPGPGYQAIEMARLGRWNVTGLDISHTFVKIASENARQASVSVDFRQGDAAAMPFEAESFDLVICQAAFKNFVLPGSALGEMHRVLRTGGTAVIQDMSRDASGADLDQEVGAMQLGRLNAFMTKQTLAMLRRRAYSGAQFERLAAKSPFQTCEIQTEGIGLEVRLKKQPLSHPATEDKGAVA